jgi:hypothetical protein
MAFQSVKWVGNETGAPAHIITKPEGSSEVFETGDLVIYDISEDGVVAVAATSGEPDSVVMLGIAQTDASGTAGTAIDVLIPQHGDIFEANLASGASARVAPDEQNLGQLYSLVKMSTATHDAITAVLEGGSGDFVKVYELSGKDATRLGVDLRGSEATLDTSSRVLFKFIAAALDSAGTQS